jgi:hypothetical protein
MVDRSLVGRSLHINQTYMVVVCLDPKDYIQSAMIVKHKVGTIDVTTKADEMDYEKMNISLLLYKNYLDSN